jgi:hypothetical protein
MKPCDRGDGSLADVPEHGFVTKDESYTNLLKALEDAIANNQYRTLFRTTEETMKYVSAGIKISKDKTVEAYAEQLTQTLRTL